MLDISNEKKNFSLDRTRLSFLSVGIVPEAYQESDSLIYFQQLLFPMQAMGVPSVDLYDIVSYGLVLSQKESSSYNEGLFRSKVFWSTKDKVLSKGSQFQMEDFFSSLRLNI